MRVVDASVVVDFLLGKGSPAGDRLADLIADRQVLIAPHLLDVEVGQAFRRLACGRAEFDGWGRLAELGWLPIQRMPHGDLLSRAWELRDNATFYDAVYLALAEVAEAPLLTGDARLVDVPGCRADVELVATT